MPWCLLKRQNIRINLNISVGNCSFLSHAVILLVLMYQCVSVKQFNLSLFIHTFTVNSMQLNFALEQIKHLFLNNCNIYLFFGEFNKYSLQIFNIPSTLQRSGGIVMKKIIVFLAFKELFF